MATATAETEPDSRQSFPTPQLNCTFCKFPMTPAFWIKRFFTVFVVAFLILLAVGLLKSRSLQRATAEGAVWAGITAVVFVSARIYQSRKGQHCALCRDTPEMAQGGQSDGPADHRPGK